MTATHAPSESRTLTLLRVGRVACQSVEQVLASIFACDDAMAGPPRFSTFFKSVSVDVELNLECRKLRQSQVDARV